MDDVIKKSTDLGGFIIDIIYGRKEVTHKRTSWIRRKGESSSLRETRKLLFVRIKKRIVVGELTGGQKTT